MQKLILSSNNIELQSHNSRPTTSNCKGIEEAHFRGQILEEIKILINCS
jgi:hypothetical protein